MRRLRSFEAASVLVLLLGVALSGCTAESSGSGPSASAVSGPPSTSSSPSTSDGAPDYRLLPDLDHPEALEPGQYGLTPVGPTTSPLAVVDVPSGFVGGLFLFPTDGTGQADECCIVGYWTVAGVYQDPCRWRAATDPGPSVQDLADALVAQRTASTRPTPVTLGGYDGLYVELTAPPGLGDLSACREGELAYWESDPGTRQFDATHYEPSKGLPLERVWILDVDGRRVVLSVGVESGVEDKESQRLIDIVESAHFVQT